jgi:hypothetical protein
VLNKEIGGIYMMRWEMGSWRVWLFRGLVAAAAALMVTSFTLPWWIANFSETAGVPGTGNIWIYGWGLRHNLSQLAGYIAEDVTPFYQTVLAWIYIAVSVGLIFFSTLLRGRKGQLLLGGVGLIYTSYAAIAAFLVIANRTASFGIPLQGLSQQVGGGGVVELTIFYIRTNLRFWYWLAYAAGGMCIVLALLRNTIIGKSRPKSQP